MKQPGDLAQCYHFVVHSGLDYRENIQQGPGSSFQPGGLQPVLQNQVHHTLEHTMCHMV